MYSLATLETKQYTIHDIVLFLDLFVSQEQLNSAIKDTENLNLLELLLHIKLHYILSGKSKKIALPINEIIGRITNANCDKICTVLSISLQVQGESSQISPIEYLKEYDLYDRNSTLIFLKLLNLLVTACDTKTLCLPNIYLKHILRVYAIILENSWKDLQNYLIIHVIDKYLKFNYKDSVYMIWSMLLKNKDLYSISCLMSTFISLDVNDRSLFETSVFWAVLSESLSNNADDKKLCIYILKQIIPHKFSRKLYLKNKLEFVQVRNSDFMSSWKDFIVLLEVMQEKQLHLITPSFPLLKKVTNLHPVWTTCIYKTMLSHTQNSVVFYAIVCILNDKHFSKDSSFKTIAKYVLQGLNMNECCESFVWAFRELGQFTKRFGDNFFVLLNESRNVTWTPCAAWYFYKTVLGNAELPLSQTLVEEMVSQVRKLPHKFIRDSCLKLMLDCVSEWLVRSRQFFSSFLTTLARFMEYDSSFLDRFLERTDCQQFYNGDEVMIFLTIASHEKEFVSLNAVRVFLKIFFNSRSAIEALAQAAEKENYRVEIRESICLRSCQLGGEVESVLAFLKGRIDEVSPHDNLDVLYEIIRHVKSDVCDPSLLQKCAFILLNTAQFNIGQTHLAFNLYNLICGSKELRPETKDIIATFKLKFVEPGTKIDPDICRCFLNLYRMYLSDENDHLPNEVPVETCTVLENIFDTQPEEVIVDVYNFVGPLLKYVNMNVRVSEFLLRSSNELTKFKRTDLFKASLNSYVEALFNSDGIECNSSLLSGILEDLCALVTTNEVAAKIVAVRLRNICQNRNSEMFVPLIVELLLYGESYRKDKRVEYETCKDIRNTLQEDDCNNPIYEGTSIRMSAVVALQDLLAELRNRAKKDYERVVRMLVSLLLGKYEKHFNKRYFPDSQIHLSKLRIIQVLLVLHKEIEYTRTDLIELVTNSFCEESHQSSVKQLMQWLLIRLLDGDDGYLDIISNKMKMASRTRTSTIIGFVPVLFHIARKKNEGCIDSIIKLMLPWTMGANFNLRLYAQVTITKLMEIAARKEYFRIVKNYAALKAAIATVLQTSGEQVKTVLQKDAEFFDYFDADDHFSLETIYIDIPKLNGVTSTEWEYIDLNDIPAHHMRVKNTDRTFSTCIDSRHNIVTPVDHADTDTYCDNIQKKIVPERSLFDCETPTKAGRQGDLIVITSLIDSSANVGGLSRTCEIFGVKQMVVNDAKVANDKEFKSLSMSSESWVSILEVKRHMLKAYLLDLAERGYAVIGAEQTSESVLLNEYRFPSKCALLLGNEREGVPPSLLPLLDACIEIPQFGVVRSLNVHVAGATFIWEYVKQHIVNTIK